MTELQVTQTGAQATIILGRKLTASEVPNLKNEMKRLISAGVSLMTLDCSILAMMDSTGIGCLVAAYNSLDKVDGKLFMIQVSSDIFSLLCSMRLDRRIKITPLAATRE
jgi:anti-sigma B factor antagonist